MNWWEDDKRMARAILRDRGARRRLIGRLLLLALCQMAGGLWVADGWLAGSAWRFLAWWAACAAVTCVVLLLALYDALAVIREERDKRE